MKLTAFVLIVFCCTASARTDAQTVTLSVENAKLETVLKTIRRQTGFTYIAKADLLATGKRVTLRLKDVTVEDALKACFQNQPFTYTIEAQIITIEPRATENPADRQPADKKPDSLPARTKTLRGKVVSDELPVPGATIIVKGTTQGANTDKDGIFVLADVADNATLVVSSVSHETREVRLNGMAFISIGLSKKMNDLDEAVIVAYSTTTQRKNVGAVTVIKGEQIQNLPNRSFEKSLQGLVPGLLITQGTGQPGGGVANFVLRGIATGADPNRGTVARQPLIVMDGVPLFQEPITTPSILTSSNNNPLAQLNPSDIETITVLKDAAAIALYGARASNGVILVTTKKGKEGKTRVGFRHQTDIAERLKGNQDMLNQEEYLELVYETFKNTDPVFWTDFRIDSALKKKFPVRADGSFYPQTDWLNELYRQQAITVATELSISGGNSRQNFYLNVEYTKQHGVEKNTGFDRKSIRFNYESQPASWLKLGVNTAASYSVQDVGMGISELGAMRISPLNPVRDESGGFIYQYQWGGGSSTNMNTIGSYFQNPAAAQQLNLSRNISYRGLTKLSGEARFLKYFRFTSLLGLDLMLTESKLRIHPKLSEGSSLPANTGSISGSNNRVANLINTNSLRFEKDWANRHHLNILAAHEAQVRTTGMMNMTKRNISSNPLTEELQVGSTPFSGTGLTAKETLLSYFGQASYGYLNRYFISGSIRTDGSSLFGENNRFGSHWSVGGGWLVSAEPFMQGANSWFDQLKLRGSIGSAGNSAAIINTMRYNQLLLTTFPSGNVLLLDVNNPPNPGIKWEKTYSWDAGLDMRLFKGRLNVNVDMYNRKTTDLLGYIQLAPATGYSNLKANIGDLKNTGLELSVSIDVVKTKNFNWNLNANWSMNRNRLVRSAFPLESTASLNPQIVNPNSITVNAPGENYNSFYLVQWAGVDAATGKPLWIDSTGKPGSNWAAAKPVFAGKPQPDGFGSFSQSFSWKGITFSMLFNYQYGFQVYSDAVNNPIANDGLDPFINQGRPALIRWQKPGDVADNPRRLLFGKTVTGVSDNATANSTRYLMDGDFIRLSNLSLSYRLPAQLLHRIKLSSGNIYLQGSNLATWTKYSGRQDPENASALGRVGSIYPLQRAWSIGVNLNL